mmetsp:Transcript_15778/g.36882  ORF Transcript_15778/g.36882 Transcript_15778/m.36882 type:complete len:140 (+) Transcript_15778:117-536(+)
MCAGGPWSKKSGAARIGALAAKQAHFTKPTTIALRALLVGGVDGPQQRNNGVARMSGEGAYHMDKCRRVQLLPLTHQQALGPMIATLAFVVVTIASSQSGPSANEFGAANMLTGVVQQLAHNLGDEKNLRCPRQPCQQG